MTSAGVEGGLPVGPRFEPPTLRRPLRATAVGRNTSGVSDVRRSVERQVHAGFPHRIWVVGQVTAVGTDEGALRFRLLSTQEDEAFALPCVVHADALPEVAELLDRHHDADVRDVVSQDRLARAGGLLRYDFVRNCLVLAVSELDPTPTALGLAEDRENGLRLARAAGLRERQRVRVCRVAPVRVALVGDAGDSGLARASRLLTDSGFAVEVHEQHTPLHGPTAAASLAQSVREVALLSDVVLLVRESGRPLGLGVFDSLEVARAVADAPVPVLAGLGGQGETTVCDEVAFATLPTADAAADWVLARLEDAEHAMRVLCDRIDDAAGSALGRARTTLTDAREAVDRAAEQATARAAAAHRRREWAVLGLAVLVALAVVAAAVVTHTPLLFLALLLPAGALLGAWLWTAYTRRRGSRPVSLHDDFAEVLGRLRQVREELTTTSSPEAVRRLRDTAAQLVAHGEQILGRQLNESTAAAESGGPARRPARDAAPGPAPDLAGPTGAGPTGAGPTHSAEDAAGPGTVADEPGEDPPAAPVPPRTSAVPRPGSVRLVPAPASEQPASEKTGAEKAGAEKGLTTAADTRASDKGATQERHRADPKDEAAKARPKEPAGAAARTSRRPSPAAPRS